MPDASHPLPDRCGTPAPRDWGDAFNALPLEMPPAGSWSRLARELPAARKPRRAPAWLALAAAAAVFAVIAWPQQAPQPTPRRIAATPRTAAAPSVAKRPSATALHQAGATPVAKGPTATPLPPAGASPVAKRPIATPLHPLRATPVAQSAVATPASPGADPVPTPSRLDTLQQESARLESLLALARDERVGNASALLLAGAFDAQVAGIDAALAAPDLDPGARESLWQARVDALQQAAGFVGTQRLLAAQGRDDTLLVSVD